MYFKACMIAEPGDASTSFSRSHSQLICFRKAELWLQWGAKTKDGWLPRKSRLELTTFQKICSTLAKGKVEIQFLGSLPNEFWIRKAFKVFSKPSRLCCRQSYCKDGFLIEAAGPLPWEVIGCQELLSSNCHWSDIRIQGDHCSVAIRKHPQLWCCNFGCASCVQEFGPAGFGEATDFGSKSFVLCFKSTWLMKTGILKTHKIP